MSFVDHRCRTCGHLWTWHAETSCSYGACRCGRSAGDFGPPAIVPTIRADLTPVETVTEPGGWVFYPSDVTCACDACVAVWGNR